MILDLAIALTVNGKLLQSVNNASNKNFAPQHSMYELSNVIPCIIHTLLARAPDTVILFLFSKVDLKEKYWRMVVNATNTFNFTYVLPPINPDNKPELVIPDSLQMGWSKSQSFFCVATENKSPPHVLEYTYSSTEQIYDTKL